MVKESEEKLYPLGRAETVGQLQSLLLQVYSSDMKLVGPDGQLGINLGLRPDSEHTPGTVVEIDCG